MLHSNSTKLQELISNLWLQVMLYCNIYITIGWALIYGFHIFLNFKHFYNFEGSFVLVAYIVALGTEQVRIYIGYAANLHMQSTLLIIFLTLAPFISIPSLLFLISTAAEHNVWIISSTCILLSLITFEFIAGIFTYVIFYKHQIL